MVSAIQLLEATAGVLNGGQCGNWSKHIRRLYFERKHVRFNMPIVFTDENLVRQRGHALAEEAMKHSYVDSLVEYMSSLQFERGLCERRPREQQLCET